MFLLLCEEDSYFTLKFKQIRVDYTVSDRLNPQNNHRTETFIWNVLYISRFIYDAKLFKTPAEPKITVPALELFTV